LLLSQELYWSDFVVIVELVMYNSEVIQTQLKKGEILMDNKALQVIAAIFIPPLAVFMKNGKIDGAFWLNIVLCFLGGFPGIIHALYLVLK
jgi:uncharacterized membrane protein YqaE (UPF0057 family)